MTKVSLKLKSFLPGSLFFYKVSILAILLMNIVFKYKQYTSRSIFWSDEIKLAFNVLEGSYLQFFEPLNYYQVAPPLFMVATKLLVNLFGENESVFRAIPFFASVLNPYVLYLIIRKQCTSFEKITTLLLFCLTPILLRYGSEFKPYATDVLCGLMMYFLFVTKRENLSGLFLWGKVLLLILLPFLSIPSFFILMGIIAGEFFLRDYKKTIIALLCLGLMAWVICYLGYYDQAKQTLFMRDFWANRIGVINDPINAFLRKNYLNFRNIFSRGFGFEIFWPVGVMLFFVGMTRLYLKKRFLSLSLFIPLFLTLFFSFLNKYPFYMRMVLFLYPAFSIAIVAGLSFFVESKKKLLRTLGAVLLFILVIAPFNKTLSTWKTPFQQNQTEKLFAFVSQSIEADDVIYVYHRTRYEWNYYWQKISKRKTNFVLGNPIFQDKEKLLQEIRRIPRQGRVWLVFSRCYESELSKIKKEFRPHFDFDKECTMAFKEEREFAYLCEYL
jgi:hypothetical protein